MHFQAVAHGAGGGAGIDVAPVGPQAVAVAKAVRHQPLTASLQLRPQALPGGLAFEISAEPIGGTLPDCSGGSWISRACQRSSRCQLTTVPSSWRGKG